MKQLYNLIVTVCIFVFAFPDVVSAQQFKWVRGGGSTENIVIGSTPSASFVEGTYNMCTDYNGNVYALSIAGNDPSIVADTFLMPSGAYGGHNNIFITSYNCNGKMRWAKLIGSANQNFGFGIACDAAGHVYVIGDLAHQSSLSAEHIGYDTAISSYRYGTCAIMQFDTNGHYKWMRFAGGNNSVSLAGTQDFGHALAIDGANNAHYLCYVKSGVDLFITTSSFGVYDLKYDPAGTLLSATRLNMDPQWTLHSAVIDPVTSKLYVCGEINQGYFGGSAIDTYFAAAFDASRNLLWQHFCGRNDGILSISMDTKKQLYFSGFADLFTTPTTFSFNGYTPSAPFTALAIIMKTDSNGSVKWVNHYDCPYTGNGFTGIALLGSDKVAAVGGYVGSTSDGTHTLTTGAGFRYNPYFVIADTAGVFVAMQQLICHASGDDCRGLSAASDRLGNLYIGGAMEDSVYGGTPAIPAYHTHGGNTDFFVAKYGYNCGCTPAAVVASFTAAGTHTVSATYAGTTASVDSIVWTFGDGGHATGVTPTHVYGASGTYTICVTVYTGCGNDTHCSAITVSVPTTGLTTREEDIVKVYPNPAKEELLVTGLIETTGYRLLNGDGVAVQHGRIRPGGSTLTLQSLSPGIYVLELTNSEGVKNNVRVVKE